MSDIKNIEPVYSLAANIKYPVEQIREKIDKNILFKFVHIVVRNKYFIDEIYRYIIICVNLLIAQFFFVVDQFIVDKFVDFWAWFMLKISQLKRWIDDTLVDGIAVNGWGYISVIAGRKLTCLQTGNIQNYLLVVCIGILLLAILGALKF